MDALDLSVSDGVAIVTMKGPGKGNAMGPPFWREMPALFRSLDADDAVRSVVVRGSGDHFSYGLDVAAMMGTLGPLLAGAQQAKERTGLLSAIREMQTAFDVVAECRKPVIAAIAGWCIGGGLDLAAACDVRLCSASARFSLREVKIAIVADLGSLQRLPAIIGEGATRELAYTGANIDAERALRVGLVNDLLPDDGALFEAARTMATAIAKNPPLVVQGIKQVMSYGHDRRVADAMRHVALWNAAFLQSKDLAEALTAFLERREPRFVGE